MCVSQDRENFEVWNLPQTMAMLTSRFLQIIVSMRIIASSELPSRILMMYVRRTTETIVTLDEGNHERVLAVERGKLNDRYLQACKSKDSRKHGFLQSIHLQFPDQWDWHDQNGYVSDDMQNRASKKDPVSIHTRCPNCLVPVTLDGLTLQHGCGYL